MSACRNTLNKSLERWLADDIAAFGCEPITQCEITAPFKESVESGALALAEDHLKNKALKLIPKWLPMHKCEMICIMRTAYPDENLTSIRCFLSVKDDDC